MTQHRGKPALTRPSATLSRRETGVWTFRGCFAQADSTLRPGFWISFPHSCRTRNVSPVGVFIMGSCHGASPSPSGRGWPEGPGEGRLVKNVAHSGPHPPLRRTLSRRERDSLQPLPTIANVQTPGSPTGCVYARRRRVRILARGERTISEPPSVTGQVKTAPREGCEDPELREQWLSADPPLLISTGLGRSRRRSQRR